MMSIPGKVGAIWILCATLVSRAFGVDEAQKRIEAVAKAFDLDSSKLVEFSKTKTHVGLVVDITSEDKGYIRDFLSAIALTLQPDGVDLIAQSYHGHPEQVYRMTASDSSGDLTRDNAASRVSVSARGNDETLDHWMDRRSSSTSRLALLEAFKNVKAALAKRGAYRLIVLSNDAGGPDSITKFKSEVEATSKQTDVHISLGSLGTWAWSPHFKSNEHLSVFSQGKNGILHALQIIPAEDGDGALTFDRKRTRTGRILPETKDGDGDRTKFPYVWVILACVAIVVITIIIIVYKTICQRESAAPTVQELRDDMVKRKEEGGDVTPTYSHGDDDWEQAHPAPKLIDSHGDDGWGQAHPAPEPIVDDVIGAKVDDEIKPKVADEIDDEVDQWTKGHFVTPEPIVDDVIGPKVDDEIEPKVADEIDDEDDQWTKGHFVTQTHSFAECIRLQSMKVKKDDSLMSSESTELSRVIARPSKETEGFSMPIEDEGPSFTESIHAQRVMLKSGRKSKNDSAPTTGGQIISRPSKSSGCFSVPDEELGLSFTESIHLKSMVLKSGKKFKDDSASID